MTCKADTTNCGIIENTMQKFKSHIRKWEEAPSPTIINVSLLKSQDSFLNHLCKDSNCEYYKMTELICIFGK